MIEVLLCCGGVFSSSYITERMRKETVTKGLEDKISFDYSPFGIAIKVINQYDIMICCSHLNIYINQFIKENDIHIPIYVLPLRMYGNMEIEEIFLDVIDIIEIYHCKKVNPTHFSNEENVFKIKRNKSYKKSVLT